MTAVLHQELLLDFNADCAEFCPAPSHQHLLCVGTYQLDEERQQRFGRLYLFEVAAEHSLGAVQKATLDCAGIFDAKWISEASTPALALALSDGSVQQVVLEPHCEQAVLSKGSAVILTTSAMVLSLSVDSTAALCIAASTSAGDLAVVKAREGGWHQEQMWKAHDLEVWSCAFDLHKAHVMYSGADDSTFRAWDLRSGPSALFVDRKAHAAGVCCIQSSPHSEHVLCTGSYDERARLWDTRNTTKPLLTSEVCAGGGVWRLKWHPARADFLAAACMHGGFAVLHVEPASGKLALHERYSGQRSLAYGVDWCHADQPAGALVASCSFYDRLLHLWTPACLAGT